MRLQTEVHRKAAQLNMSDAAVKGMSRLVAGLAADKEAREKIDRQWLETGRKAFMMQMELSSDLMTTKDEYRKMLLEMGYKKAESGRANA